MNKYQSPLQSLPDEPMRLLGIIAVHWEWIEVLLERAIAEVMSLKNEPRVGLLTANLSFHAKCDLIAIHASPLKALDPNLHKEFAKTLEGLKDAYSDRNKFIHGKWVVEQGVLLRHEIRTRNGKLTIARERTTETDLSNAAQRIYEAADSFVRLQQRYGLLKE